MTNKELVEKLREHADWAGANEWDAPITLGDDLSAAADALEARHGHWEASEVPPFDWECSACGTAIRWDDPTGAMIAPYYCPCCGAEMDSEAE